MPALKIFLTSLFVSVVGEIPCLLRTIIIATRFDHPLAIFFGTMLGSAIMAGLGIYAGEHLRLITTPHFLRIFAGIAFMIFGFLILADKIH